MWTCWVCNVLGCGRHNSSNNHSDSNCDKDLPDTQPVPVPLTIVDSPGPLDDNSEVKRTSSDPSLLVAHAASDVTIGTFEVEVVEFTKTPSVKRFREKLDARRDQIVKVDVHSGGASEDGQEHEYEDIYLAQNEEARDSGKHSRTDSSSSNNSTTLAAQQQLHSPESGVSSASPSDLGQSEEEVDKMKLAEMLNNKSVDESDQMPNNLQSTDNEKYNTINSNSGTAINNINLNFNNNNNNSTINRNSLKSPSNKTNNTATTKSYSSGSVASIVDEIAKIDEPNNDFPVRNSEIKSNTLNVKSESNKSVMNFVDDLNKCNTLNGPLNDIRMNGHQELNRASSVEFYGNKEINRRPSTTSVESYGTKSLKKSSLNGSVEIINQNVYGVLETETENIYSNSKDKISQSNGSLSRKTENIYEVAESIRSTKESNIYQDINTHTLNNKEHNVIMNGTVKEQNLQNSLYNGKELLSKNNGLTRSLNDINSSNNIYVAPSLDSGIDDGDKLTSSDLDENKLRLSLPNQGSNAESSDNSRALKRVVSEPANMCPVPPPPPPPPNEETVSLPPNVTTTAQEDVGNSASVSTSGTLPHPPNTGTTPSEAGTLTPHTLKKQMVLPFIPPKFGSSNDSNSLIKPSEYLRSISGGSAESVPAAGSGTSPGVPVPPPPPVPQVPAPPPPPPQPQDTPPKPPQPLSTISIHDLNSVQLRRTKQPAFKTMSAPPKSLTGMSDQPFQSQKEDLIAELKLSKDIPGIKKLKVERVKLEEKQDKEVHSELVRQFSVENFVEKMPEKDSAGNPIPPWKRQMLAKKAAEKARKEMEEQMAKEAEEKRLQSIPAWKRHLLAQRKQDDKIPSPVHVQVPVYDEKKPLVEIEVKAEPVPENKENSQPPPVVNKSEPDSKIEEESAHIIPWRAQLRKTNSTLNLLE